MGFLDRRLLPIILGESLEAYDFFLYGLLSVFIAKTFFPQHAPELTLIYSFSLFSVAYIAQPLGALIWGHVADKYGRKPVLMSTLSLMALPAIGMAIMPSYESIGVTATILVVFLRFLQGVAFGGEAPTIAVTLYEAAPDNKKGYFGSFYNPGILLGFLLGIILFVLLTNILGELNMQSFGWRVMFALSLIFIFILSYIRLKLVETGRSHRQKNTPPIVETIKNDLPAIVKIFFYFSCCTVLFWNLFFHNYLIINSNQLGLKALLLQACVVVFMIVLMPIVGLLSDKVNKISLLKITYTVIIFISPFLYMIFLSNNLFCVLAGYLVLAVFTAITCATYPAVIVPQASKHCRVTTIAIASSFSVMFGSFVPLLNETMKFITNISIAPSFLISLCAAISLFTTYQLKTKDIK